MSEKEVDDVSGTQTTGHEWDGIKELDTPMPRWWLGILYATIVWAIGYWVVYPAWPGINSYTHGVLDYSQRDEVIANVAALKADRAGREQLEPSVRPDDRYSRIPLQNAERFRFLLLARLDDRL